MATNYRPGCPGEQLGCFSTRDLTQSCFEVGSSRHACAQHSQKHSFRDVTVGILVPMRSTVQTSGHEAPSSRSAASSSQSSTPCANGRTTCNHNLYSIRCKEHTTHNHRPDEIGLRRPKPHELNIPKRSLPRRIFGAQLSGVPLFSEMPWLCLDYPGSRAGTSSTTGN